MLYLYNPSSCTHSHSLSFSLLLCPCSNAPTSSTPTPNTRAEFQLATEGVTDPRYYTIEEQEDAEDTVSDQEDELEPEEEIEEDEEEEEEDDGGDVDLTMEDFSNHHRLTYTTTATTTSTLSLHTGSRSLSWPGSIQSSQSQRSNHREDTQHHEQQEDRDLQSPSSTSPINGYHLSSDKSPLWVHPSYSRNVSMSQSSDVVSPLQKQPQPQHSVILQGAGTPTQIPIGGPFIYQLAPGQTFASGSRQQLIAPILTVLPANTSLVNPTLARTMSVPSSAQPIVLSSLGLSPVTQQALSATQQQQQDAENTDRFKTITISNTEPTTGQTMTSPLMEQAPVHTMAGHTSPTRTLASIPLSELTPQYSELKAFAEEFKSKRIRLGFTQGAVGQSLADKGYSNFAQSTISRFEQMQLSPTNAAAIKQVLEKWLQEAENPDAAHSASSTSNLPFMASRKRKKRAVFTPQTRTSLDNFFKQNPRPNRQMIESIANQLELLPEEVRVWFCNKRQKHKQHQTIYHYDQDLNLSTSSGANSPTSLYETTVGVKRNTPSPKTPFTIEELSKSSTSSSSAVTATQLTSPFMSPTSLVMAVSTPKMFFNPIAPVTTTTAVPRFLSSPPWSVAQTTA